MFSNDQNIETIAQLVEILKRYLSTKSDLWRIDITEKVVKLFTAMAMIFILSFILVLVLIYLSFTIAYALSTFIGLSFAFLSVTSVYILIFLLCIVNRKRWIERPLVRFLAELLIDR
ncbi:MAG: phage holin family protein [Prevotella sp.]